MKRIAFAAIALAASFTFASAEEAKEPSKRGPDRFVGFLKHADADKNGAVTREEFDAATAKRIEESFKQLDANGDGSVDAEEFKKGNARESAFDRLDANKDGKIDKGDKGRKKHR